jgi:YVTN family beta-propeller protein
VSKKRLVLGIALAAAAFGATAARADLPSGGTLVATVQVPTPRDVTNGFGSIWVSNGPSQTVTRIDPATNAVTATIPVPTPASVLAVGAGAVWVTSVPANTVTRIDPSSNSATGTISLAPAGDGPVGITVAYGSVWVADHDGQPTTSVAKIDPSTLLIEDVIPIGSLSFAGPNWMSAGAGSIWTDVPNLEAVVRIDPVSDSIVATIPDKGACGAVVATDTAVWVAGGGGAGCLPGITGIDPLTNTVTARLNAGGQTNSLALNAGTLWYGTALSNFLGRIDTAAPAVVGQLKLPGAAFGLTAAFGNVWATDRDDGLLFKIQPG